MEVEEEGDNEEEEEEVELVSRKTAVYGLRTKRIKELDEDVAVLGPIPTLESLQGDTILAEGMTLKSRVAAIRACRAYNEATNRSHRMKRADWQRIDSVCSQQESYPFVCTIVAITEPSYKWVVKQLVPDGKDCRKLRQNYLRSEIVEAILTNEENFNWRDHVAVENACLR